VVWCGVVPERGGILNHWSDYQLVRKGWRGRGGVVAAVQRDVLLGEQLRLECSVTERTAVCHI
jgi:hypothetical protein